MGVSGALNNSSTLLMTKLSDMPTLRVNAYKLSHLLQGPHSMLETVATLVVSSLSAGSLTEPSLLTMA